MLTLFKCRRAVALRRTSDDRHVDSSYSFRVGLFPGRRMEASTAQTVGIGENGGCRSTFPFGSSFAALIVEAVSRGNMISLRYTVYSTHVTPAAILAR